MLRTTIFVFLYIAVSCFDAGWSPLLAENVSTQGIDKLIKDGKAYLDARYRFEYVEQDDFSKTAKASTLRSKLGFESGKFYDFSFKVEFEDVTEVGNDLYNSTVNARSQFPVVADPDGTEVNQALIAYNGIPATILKVGRENLTLGNHRFIGDVGWRQNNQTYDTANITNQSITNLKLFYAFVGNVNRIFGDGSPQGDWETNLQLFNVQYAGIPNAQWTSYVYLFDIEDAENFSTINFGNQLEGTVALSTNVSWFYDLEYAYQEDYQDNPISFQTNYWRVVSGTRMYGAKIMAGYESLGSDNGEVGFSTPFATLHKWNGWADKFLTTPPDGLNDAFSGIEYSILEISTLIDKITLQAIYHHFVSEETSSKFGDEWDFDISVDFYKNYSFGVKYALYNAASFATDTEKLILTLSVQFK